MTAGGIDESDNFDSSRWRVFYDGALNEPVWEPSRQRFVHSLAPQARQVYGDQVVRSLANCAGQENPEPSWGFHSREPDCKLQIETRCSIPVALTPLCPIASTAYEDSVRILVNAAAEDVLHAGGRYVNRELHDTAAIARAIISHEHFHNLEFVVSGEDALWATLGEGAAVFAQTAIDPAVEADPSSVFIAWANDFQQHPSRALCDQEYAAAPFWGYLYARDGGIGTIRAILAEVDQQGLACSVGLAGAVDRALAVRPGLHDSHAEALAGFAVAAYERDLEWGRPDGSGAEDFGQHMQEVLSPPLVPAAPNLVGSWGIHYATLPPGGTYDVSWTSDDASWIVRLLLRREDGSLEVLRVPAGEAVRATIPLGGEAALAAVRAAANDGLYAVVLTPVAG